jgi:hypothetical protein
VYTGANEKTGTRYEYATGNGKEHRYLLFDIDKYADGLYRR